MIKLSGQMEGISVRGDSRYTYALRIGERTKLVSTLYRGYRTKELNKDPGTPSARVIKLSGQMEGISVRGDSRYTYALRIGERTKLVDRKTTVQARWRASASMVDTNLGDTEP